MIQCGAQDFFMIQCGAQECSMIKMGALECLMLCCNTISQSTSNKHHYHHYKINLHHIGNKSDKVENREVPTIIGEEFALRNNMR